MKVEHWASQATHPDRQLDWKNLLAACPGDGTTAERDRHCDAAKGRSPLSINPLDPRTDHTIRYDAQGRVVVDDQELQRQIDQVIRLNLAFLCRNRKKVLDVLVKAESSNRAGSWPAGHLQRRIRDLETPREGTLPEFLGVLVFWLRRKERARR